MASNGQELISEEELKRLGEVLKDDKFRQLLLEYAEGILDPQNRQRYEQELSILERERGVDITFIHPEAGYVIKTSTSDAIKTFINICKNKNAVKPSCSRCTTKAGLDWSVPYFLSVPRDYTEKTGRKCRIHDVVFHPDTLYMAQRNARFRKMIEDTALDGIQQKFAIRLDRRNLHYPKLKYKGIPIPTVLRKPTNQTIDEDNIEKLKGTTLYEAEKNESNKGTVKLNKDVEIPVGANSCLTPKHSLRYRNNINMKDFTVIAQQSANVRPDEIVIEIHLPLLTSAKGVNLDVDKQSLTLMCTEKANYKLDLSLPFPVNNKKGNAQFDQSTHTLTVTLPVPPYQVPKSSETYQEIFSEVQVESVKSERLISHRCTMGNLCTPSLAYEIPPFIVHQSNNHVTFVFEVQNVNINQVSLQICDCNFGFQLVFPSAANNVWHSFCIFSPFGIKLEDRNLDSSEMNLVLKLSKKENIEWVGFSYGCYEAKGDQYTFINKNNVLGKLKNLKNDTEQFLNLGESLQNEQVNVKSVSEESLQVQVHFEFSSEKESTPEVYTDEYEEDLCENASYKYKHMAVKELSAITGVSRSPRKNRTSSESSLDLQCNLSGRRGILKYPRNWRSVSESSDDVGCCYPLDFLPPSLEEDDDDPLGQDNIPKKNVRFNDHVAKNIFRANSSILGQKKKNQKRAQYKKRVAQRSNSTSSQDETESQESTATTEEDSEHSSCNESSSGIPRKKKTSNEHCSEYLANQEKNAIIDYLVAESNVKLEEAIFDDEPTCGDNCQEDERINGTKEPNEKEESVCEINPLDGLISENGQLLNGDVKSNINPQLVEQMDELVLRSTAKMINSNNHLEDLVDHINRLELPILEPTEDDFQEVNAGKSNSPKEFVEQINQKEVPIDVHAGDDHQMIYSNDIVDEILVPEILLDENNVLEILEEDSNEMGLEMKKLSLNDASSPQTSLRKTMNEFIGTIKEEATNDVEVAANKVRTNSDVIEDLDFRTTSDVYVQEVVELFLSPENTAFQLD